MKESLPEFKNEKEQKKIELIASAKEIEQNPEAFPFPGIEESAHKKMQAEDEEFPGYTTPIDQILQRCQDEGIKVVLGKNPESGNFFILPFLSNNIEMDSLQPKHLRLDQINDEKLKQLILLSRG